MQTVPQSSDPAAAPVAAPPPQRPWVLKSLPPFPSVAMRLLEVLAQEKLHIKDVVELVRMDPAFGAEILRLANSAAYGFRSQIDSLSHAMVLLGTERVRSLTLTVAMNTYLKRAFRDEDLRACWHHSLATAFLSGTLAAPASMNMDRAYTAGLLHDVGRLALLAGYPVEYSNLIAVANENHLDIMAVERGMFDIDHAEAGRWLADEWRFPTELRDVIATHHLADPKGRLTLAAVIGLACRLAAILGFGVIRPLRDACYEDVLRDIPENLRAGLPEETTLRERIERKVNAFAG
ncbi:MAG: HDOD domain-containing protein [Bryobacterales bacterium]|nr:HDOD domain-containing protein [Bryobacterales bacterium]